MEPIIISLNKQGFWKPTLNVIKGYPSHRNDWLLTQIGVLNEPVVLRLSELLEKLRKGSRRSRERNHGRR